MATRGMRALQRINLDHVEALRFLGSVSLGRIVYTRQALPTVRPVNHVLDNGDILIRTHEAAALTSHAQQADGTGAVVAYEADAIDPDSHLGWRESTDQAVRIRPELVTGVLLTRTENTANQPADS
ncbi:pyridoxamine 5'-phosphate oxidase family protein [Streptomyces sp. NPDC086787]|uniref:pyridoxamine 5'-phosphate oxidase family protein n=1 Tax=Streptomyces sp. NPDC086787 TaxID=3365759 RepID=UPI00380B71DC